MNITRLPFICFSNYLVISPISVKEGLDSPFVCVSGRSKYQVWKGATQLWENTKTLEPQSCQIHLKLLKNFVFCSNNVYYVNSALLCLGIQKICSIDIRWIIDGVP